MKLSKIKLGILQNMVVDHFNAQSLLLWVLLCCIKQHLIRVVKIILSVVQT